MPASTADDPEPNAVHLVVLLHGLFGSPSHVGYLAAALTREAASRAGDEGDSTGRGRKLGVLVARSNGITFGHTFDGIDVCAARVVEEIDAEVQRVEREGGRVERFSMVGYSLGGLVARYVLGLLDSRTPSFFSAITPSSFTTFASPAIGIPAYQSFWSRFFRALGERLLSRTGRQLYERDAFLPSSRFDSEVAGETKGTRGWRRARKEPRRGEPLLKLMADPQYSFYRALAKFARVEIFANTVNDRTVPFPTGAIEELDPFAVARLKAEKVARDRGDDPYAPLDLGDGGLELEFLLGVPIVSSFRQLSAPPSATSPRRRRLLRFRLPLLFRPITYPLPRSLAYVVIASLPVVYPFVLAILITRSLLHIPQSKRRMRRTRARIGGGRDGWLERVGLRMEGIVEALQPDNPEAGAGLEAAHVGVPAPEGHSRCGKKEGTAAIDGQDSPTSSAGSSTALLSTIPAHTASSPSKHGSAPSPSPAETEQYLSPSQLFQIRHLNALPNLHKYLVHLPDSEYAHGAIICRNPKHAAQSRKEVVDWWAGRFEL